MVRDDSAIPFFSIVTICYNARNEIERTIKSVLSQSEKVYEYIIIDGKSTDGTIEVIEKYHGRISMIVSEPDKGIYDAMNKGIRLSKGIYLGFINAGDWYEADALREAAEALKKNPDLDGVSGMLRVYNEGEIARVQGIPFSCIRKEGMIQHPATFLKRSVYLEQGLYDPSLRSAADYDFFIRLYDTGKKLFFIEKILANFSRGGVSGSMAGRLEELKVQRKYGLISRKHYFLKRLMYSARKFLG